MNNNTFAIESFISFCDDMMIAEEGFKDGIKNVWITIRTIFKKLIQIFKNFIMNINYFKTAKLPSQQSKDIITVVQNLTPRYEVLNKMFMLIYRVSGISGGKNAYDDLYVEIEQSMNDVDEIITTAKNSSEYKRIESNDYDKKTVVDIPLSNIVSAMKKSQNDLIKYDANAQKMEVLESSATSESQRKTAGRCRQIFTKLCEIYKLKVRLLKTFFEHAKSSMGAIKKNISEKKYGENDPNRRYSTGKNFVDMLIKRGAAKKLVKVTPEQEKRFKELDKIVIESNNDPSKYSEYYKAYSELCKMAGVGTNVVLVYGEPGKKNGMLPETKDGELAFLALKEDSKPMKLLSNTQLYHTSPDENLKELTGRYYHTSLNIRRLWSTPRMYFSIGNAMAKDGSNFNGSDPMAIYERSNPRSLYKYVPVNHIDTVHRDVEMGIGSAVYVESKTPIKLRKIN